MVSIKTNHESTSSEIKNVDFKVDEINNVYTFSIVYAVISVKCFLFFFLVPSYHQN